MLRRCNRELDSENVKLDKEIAVLREKLEKAESTIENLKKELLKTQTEMVLSKTGSGDIR